jgi:hypothetical protein
MAMFFSSSGTVDSLTNITDAMSEENHKPAAKLD